MKEPTLKEQLMFMAAADLEQLLVIIGDVDVIGYKVLIAKLQGLSLQQCATKFGMKKARAQRIIKRCIEKQYDKDITRILRLN